MEKGTSSEDWNNGKKLTMSDKNLTSQLNRGH